MFPLNHSSAWALDAKHAPCQCHVFLPEFRLGKVGWSNWNLDQWSYTVLNIPGLLNYSKPGDETQDFCIIYLKKTESSSVTCQNPIPRYLKYLDILQNNLFKFLNLYKIINNKSSYSFNFYLKVIFSAMSEI